MLCFLKRMLFLFRNVRPEDLFVDRIRNRVRPGSKHFWFVLWCLRHEPVVIDAAIFQWLSHIVAPDAVATAFGSRTAALGGAISHSTARPLLVLMMRPCASS